MLTKNEWKALFFATMTVYAVFGLWYRFSSVKKYADLSESYTAEKHIADMMADVIADKNKQIDDLNQQIVDLKEQLPK